MDGLRGLACFVLVGLRHGGFDRPVDHSRWDENMVLFRGVISGSFDQHVALTLCVENKTSPKRMRVVEKPPKLFFFSCTEQSGRWSGEYIKEIKQPRLCSLANPPSSARESKKHVGNTRVGLLSAKHRLRSELVYVQYQHYENYQRLIPCSG